MKVVIVNGSPHSKNGVTSHYTKYLEIKFPEYEFNTIEVAKKIKKLEQNKDYFTKVIKQIEEADVVIYAGAVKDRYYSARFKKFIDRYFSNGHRHVLNAGLLGHIVSGPLNQFLPMKETLEAHIEVAHCQRLGIVSNEHPDPNVTVKNINNMIKFLEHWLENKEWTSPQTFLGVGGGKIFRDLVYFNRGVMGADYRFYKKEKLLDFPTRNYTQRLIGKLLLTMQKIPAMQKEFKIGMNDNRLKPYRKLLEETQKDIPLLII